MEFGTGAGHAGLSISYCLKQHGLNHIVFERGKIGLKEKLTELYNEKTRLIYVGEWHSHPDGLPIPSGTDFNAMKEIAESDEVVIQNPVLLILGITKALILM